MAAGRELTAEQLATTRRLRAAVAPLIDAHEPPLHPLDAYETAVLRLDGELARFLRSRVWNEEQARDGVIGWLAWRRSYRPTQITASDCCPKIARSGCFFFHGYDNIGQPLCYLNISLIDPSEGEIERRQRYIIMQMERSKRMIALDGSANRCAAVFDLSGAGLANLDRPLLMFLLKKIKENYPDSFGRVYLLNMPWAFQMVWAGVKPLLAKHAQEKAIFVDQEGGLLEYVERKWLLEKYGGDGAYDSQAAADADAAAATAEPEPEPEPEPELAVTEGAEEDEDGEDVFYDALPGPVRKEADSLRGAVDDVRRNVQTLLGAFERLEAREDARRRAEGDAAGSIRPGGGGLSWFAAKAAAVLCHRWTWVGIAVVAFAFGVRRRRLLTRR